jgi:hypothetical protein
MTPLIADLIWLFVTVYLGIFVFGKNLEEKDKGKTTLIIVFISFFVYQTLYRSVIVSGGSFILALKIGGVVGAIAFLISGGIKMLIVNRTRDRMM